MEESRSHRNLNTAGRDACKYQPLTATQTLMVDDNPSVFISPSRIGLHWQALAAALEVNKTVKQVGLSDANLNDEGRQVQLRYLWVVVLVLQSGPFLDLTS